MGNKAGFTTPTTPSGHSTNYVITKLRNDLQEPLPPPKGESARSPAVVQVLVGAGRGGRFLVEQTKMSHGGSNNNNRYFIMILIKLIKNFSHSFCRGRGRIYASLLTMKEERECHSFL